MRKTFETVSFFMTGVIFAGLIGRVFWYDIPIWQRWAVVLLGGVIFLTFYWSTRRTPR